MTKIKSWWRFETGDLKKRIHYYSRVRMALFLAALAGFFVSVFWLWLKSSSPQISFFDRMAMKFINCFDFPFLKSFLSLITHLGSSFFIGSAFLILALILVIKRRKRAAAVSLLSLLGSSLFIYLLKDFFDRPRPFSCLGDDCLSFPSGHTTLAFYFYGLFFYLVWRFIPLSKKQLKCFGLSIGTLIFLIALSRVFLGYHYPSDVLAGFFLGGSWLILAILLIDFLY
jgi:undecaprenyl-diphosphatase